MRIVALCLSSCLLSTLYAQIPDFPDETIAGIQVNYTEAKVGSYSLPELLVLADGNPVRDAQTWMNQRRPEIVKLLEENEYGRYPGRPDGLHFDIFDPGTPAFSGKALRRQVRVHFTADPNGPYMDLLIYLPAKATGPVPLLLNLGFSPNSSQVDDPGVRPGLMWNREHKRVPVPEDRKRGTFDVGSFLDRDFGVALIYYGDIEPDFSGGFSLGVRKTFLKPGQQAFAPDEWGAISAWAWGLSRALDYFETDPGVDARRVGLMGVSRLGKTVLWAGARDSRFAMVIASCSGEGGAALSRRFYGETIAHLASPKWLAYQFCGNLQKWGNDNVDQFPVDSHMVLALIAPRPVLLQTGNTDKWSDPKGEFDAAVAADPVYKLLGEDGLGIDQVPPAGEPHLNTLGYFMHDGGHGTRPGDWDVFFEFMERHLR